jgi:DNA-binding GntR family transcriptional regulator
VSPRWEDAHEAFHQGLVAGVMRPLKVQIDGLMARADRYVRLGIRWDAPSVLETVQSEHAAIAEACYAEDAPAAAALLAGHLAHSAHTIGSYIAPGEPLPAVTAAHETTYAR